MNFLGLTAATLVAIYTFLYAFHLWRDRRNLLGALIVAGLGLAAVALPAYSLYFRD